MANYRNIPRKAMLETLPKNGICAEIGVWKGEFSEHILAITTPKKVHLIDPWTFQPQFGGNWYGGQIAKSQKDMNDIFNVVEHKFKNKAIIHREYSDIAFNHFDDGYFDWIYIDGNHNYAYVMKDLMLYYPKVKSGGYITGDDYDMSDVIRAVGEFCTKYGKTVEIFGKTQFCIKI